MVFEWNSFAFISLICFLMSSASAILTLFAKRQGEALLWGLICVLLSVWTFGLFLGFQADSPEDALLFIKTINYIIIFLPAVLFHFCATFIEKRNNYRRIIWLYYFISGCYFIVAFVFQDDFLHGGSFRFSSFWFPYAGPLFYIFPVLYIFLVGHAIQILVLAKRIQDKVQQRKTNYLLVTILMGLIGSGSSLSLEFGFDIPPYGIFSIAFVVLIATYAILKHDLLDLPQTFSLITARVLIYIVIFAVVVLVIKAGAFFDNLTFSSFQMLVISILLVLVCELYALMKSNVQFLSDAMITRRKITTERQFKRLINQLEKAYDFEAMLPLLRSFLEKQAFVYHYAWYLDQCLLGQSLKKESIKDYERHQNLNESTYQRILFSARDGKRHDRLPSALRMDEKAIKQDSDVSSQIMTLMNSEQLDSAYEWVDRVPGRELIALPLVANTNLRGLIVLVVSQTEMQYSDQSMIQTLSAKLALLIERFDSIREETRLQQAFLLEKMASLRALAGDMAQELRLPLTHMDQFVAEVYSVSRSIQVLDTSSGSGLAVSSLSTKLRTDANQARLAIDRSLQLIDIISRQVSSPNIDVHEFEVCSIQNVLSRALAEYVFLSKEREFISINSAEDFKFKGDDTLLVYVIFNIFKHAFYQQDYPADFDIHISTKIKQSNNSLIVKYNHQASLVSQLGRQNSEKETQTSSSRLQDLNLSFSFCRRVMSAFGGEFVYTSISDTVSEITLAFPFYGAES